MSDITYTLPVGIAGGQFSSHADTPEYITGRLVFRLETYTDYKGKLERWIHARFYFDPQLWDVDKYGLVYTDETFMNALHARLRVAGWIKPERGINYSENGMQGANYVDFDVGRNKTTMMNLLATGVKLHDTWPEQAHRPVTA